jgi:diguanylate cyclase (GGDEF)-like protein
MDTRGSHPASPPWPGFRHELRRGLKRRELIAGDEVPLAGVVSGVLWLTGGITLLPIMFFPGVPHSHRALLITVAVAATATGLSSIRLIDWRRTPVWAFHISVLVGLAIIALTVWATNGALSPAWTYLFFVVLFAPYFFPIPVAAGYLLLCVLVHGLPLLYDGRATHAQFLAMWLLGSASYCVLGSAVGAGKALMWMHRRQAERLAAQQSALREIATAVVDGADEATIYALVAREVAELLDGGAAGIMRLDSPTSATVIGSWADHPEGRYPPGTVVAIRPGSDVEETIRTGRPVRVESHPPESPVRRLGYAASIVAPVHASGRTWGVLAVTAASADRLTEVDEQRLSEFGDLLATAIASLEDRAKLAAQASSDPLTGLANHRVLHERLRAQLGTAVAQGRDLAVVVLDLDHFKQINDIGGHDLGDETLIRVGDCLRRMTRPDDVLGRAGGDEFTWIMPGVRSREALERVQAARVVIEATVSRSYRVTISGGICDTRVSTDASELIRLADGALYWSKAHGRDQCQVYDPSVVDELSAHERAERLARSQALVGLRALARAIDAKDPATREHSERVAALAAELARLAGWSRERARLLGEAALVHDVGKIGVPDAILFKRGRLTDAEREQVNLHAELSARIVEGVLGDEQVEWIRTHHERPDGAGYPKGLRGAEIPEGASLLAIADAFDVMTVGRPYSRRRTTGEALEECMRLVGAHFSLLAVNALERLLSEAERNPDTAAGPVLSPATPELSLAAPEPAAG